MKKKPTIYKCPYISACPLHKRCHVLTTETAIPIQICVVQKCPAAGKNADGTTKEILIHIGHVA